MWLAEIAGFNEADAFELAKYDQAVDDHPLTQPLWGLDGPGTSRRADFHFVGKTRLRQLKRDAESCRRGKTSAEQHTRIGTYLHASEDVYSHRTHDARFGHLIGGHTPDKPWSQPGDFVAMVEAKFEALLALRLRCAGKGPPVEEVRLAYKRAAALLDAWKREEYDAGVDDPESPGRFDQLARALYGPRFGVYVNVQPKAYSEWLQQRQLDRWRAP